MKNKVRDLYKRGHNFKIHVESIGAVHNFHSYAEQTRSVLYGLWGLAKYVGTPHRHIHFSISGRIFGIYHRLTKALNYVGSGRRI